MSYARSFVQNLINGFMSTILIYTGCELGIFDSLETRSKSIDELSEELEISEIDLLRIIRPLGQYKLLNIKEKEVGLSELGEILLSDKVDSLGAYALFSGRESLAAWSRMYPAIKNKRKPRELVGQSGIFNDLEENCGEFDTFNKMMSSVSGQLDFSEVFVKLKEKNEKMIIADVGGGTGTIIKKFLHYYKNATGIILDLQQAKQDALNNIKVDSLEERCSFIENDFFKPIDTKADIYILSRVLHDWKDEEAGYILKNVADIMEDDGRLVVLEEVIKKADEPGAMRSYVNDIQMWVFCDGKERTSEEFETLFFDSGLKIEEIIYTSEGTTAMIVKKHDEEIGEI